MLLAVWSLRDVIDVEALCRGVIRDLTGARSTDRTTRPGDWLEPCDYQVSLAFLLGEVVVQEQRWLEKGLDEKPGDERGPILFRPWLYQQLRSRLIDEWRSPRMFGRHGQHRVAPVDRLVRTVDRDGGPVATDLRADRLHGAAGGDAADRTDADRWLRADGDLDTVGVERGEGRVVGAAAAGIDDRPGAGARGPVGRAVAGASAVAAFVDCECGWRSYRQAPNGVTRWHLPDFCAGCGGALLELVDPVPAPASLEEREELAA
jgi:hypothetical protein